MSACWGHWCFHNVVSWFCENVSVSQVILSSSVNGVDTIKKDHQKSWGLMSRIDQIMTLSRVVVDQRGSGHTDWGMGPWAIWWPHVTGRTVLCTMDSAIAKQWHAYHRKTHQQLGSTPSRRGRACEALSFRWRIMTSNMIVHKLWKLSRTNWDHLETLQGTPGDP